MKRVKGVNGENDENKIIQLQDEDSSDTSYKKKSLSFFGNNRVKLSSAFKRAYGYCFATAFESMQIQSSLDSVTITYPINHCVHNGHITDLFDGSLPLYFLSEGLKEPNNSSLKLKFTRCGAKRFLFLECAAYRDIYDYDLGDLLAIFAKQDVKTKSFSQFKEVAFKVNDQKKCLNVGALSVDIRHLVTHDDLDYDGVSIKNLLQEVSNFNLNCLKRFEELTYHENGKDYVQAHELGNILDEMVLNYKAVPYQLYKTALNKLGAIERTEVYQNDPLIQLSLTDIRKTIEALSTKALHAGRGIEINEQQLGLILQELFLHEGIKPEKGVWFPVGTVKKLSQQIDAFFSLYQYAPKSSQGFVN